MYYIVFFENHGAIKGFATFFTREVFMYTGDHLMLFETCVTNKVLTAIHARKLFICAMHYIVFFETLG